MGNENDKVQKQYKPPPGGVQQTKMQTSQLSNNSRKNLVVPNSNPPLPPPTNVQSNPKNPVIQPEVANPRKETNVLASSTSRRKELTESQEREVKLRQSSVRIKEDKEVASSVMVSSFKVQGFEGEQFKGRKVKKFNISAQIPEKELIKESNYFDQSNTDLGLQPRLHTRYADFSVGDFEQLSTFPVKTYLFDHALNGKLVA